MKIRTIHGYIDLYSNKLYEAAPTGNPDDFGDTVGITDKSDKASNNNLEQPESGPIGSISDSAWANLNVPTRGIPGTSSKSKPGSGNLGCAAATSIMFYRATGYPIIPGKKIVLGTSTLWNSFSKSKDWEKITDWKNNYQPGDIILTSRGSKAGHVGIVVEDGKIISNSSGGFKGDKKGQIEKNYSINGWKSVAARNPNKTAIFRYKGKYKKIWGGEGEHRDESNTGSSGTMFHIMSGNKFKWGGGPAAHAKRAFGNWQSDRAYDLMAPKGTPVLSIFSGKISKVQLMDSSNKKVYGWSLTIKSDSGDETFYTHLGKLEDDIKVGNSIKVGDLVGYIGRPEDGRRWYEHVHIGIKNRDLKDYIDESGNIKGTGTKKLVNGNSEVGSSESLVSKGSMVDEVKKIQRALVEVWKIPLPIHGIDGKFGDETEKAIMKFQSDNPPLEVDGIVGPETRKLLYSENKNISVTPNEISDKTLNTSTPSKTTYNNVIKSYIGKKYKAYYKEDKKVIVISVNKDGTLLFKSKIGRYLGGTRMADGKVEIFYKDESIDPTDQTNTLVKGVLMIINMIFSKTEIPKSSPTDVPKTAPVEEPKSAPVEEPKSAPVEVEDVERVNPNVGSGLNPILNLAAKGESGGDYNIYNYGRSGSSGARTSTKGSRYYNSKAYNLSELTINQIISLQGSYKIFAAGKYQTIPKTLKSAAAKLGLLNSKFNKQTQDKIAEYLMVSASRKRLSAYLKGSNKGSISDLEGAVQDIGQIWASKPIIFKQGYRYGNVETGKGKKSYYGGVGVNRDTSATDVGSVVVNLIKSRIQYSGKTPEFIPNYYNS